MTVQPNNHRSIDELVSDQLDGEPGIQTPQNAMEGLDSRQLRRAADLQLVHSLLVQVGQENDIARERRVRRVRRVMDGIAGTWLRRFVQPMLRYGVAAVLAMAALVFFMKMPDNSAMAAVDKMIAAIDLAGDRTYSIAVIDGRKDAAGQAPRQPGERAGLDGATLYLRGSGQFVLFRRTPSGKTLINGNDGQTRWLIRPNKPVLVSDNPQAFRIPMPPELAQILTMDLKATLLHIRNNYEVKFQSDIPAEAAGGSKWTYLDAVKMSSDVPGPRNIEMWADSQTGTLVRIEFAGVHLQGDPAPKRMTIDLVDQKQLSDDWFTRQAHHPQDAQVDSVSDE